MESKKDRGRLRPASANMFQLSVGCGERTSPQVWSEVYEGKVRAVNQNGRITGQRQGDTARFSKKLKPSVDVPVVKHERSSM